MKQTLYFLAFVLLPIPTLKAQLNGSYTINSDSVTLNRNFQSFSDFTTALSNQGVSSTVNVNVIDSSGPYHERVEFTAFAGASDTNRVIINGHGETVWFDPDSLDYRVVGFDGAQYITLKNLRIESHDSLYGFGIHFTNNADHNTIENCIIDMSRINSYKTTKVYSVGIISSSGDTITYPKTSISASYLTLKSNYIIGDSNGSAYSGIRLNGSFTINNIGNIIEDNTIINSYNSGIMVYGQEDIRISGNEISRPTRIISAGIISGITIAGGKSEGVIVEQNEIYNLAGVQNGQAYGIHGIKVMSVSAPAPSKPIVIQNNIIYGIKISNGYLMGIVNNAVDNVKILHNTVSFEDSSYASGGTKGIYQANGSQFVEGFVVKNNIISIKRRTHSDQYGIDIDKISSQPVICDYNSVYVNSSGLGTDYYGAVGSTNYSDLAAWRTATSIFNTPVNFGQNSFEIDPQFLAPDDLMPLSVALHSSGDTVGVLYDFYGDPRDTLMPDLGAVNAGCFKPVDLQSIVTDTIAALNWTDHNSTTLWQLAMDTAGFDLNDTTTYFFVHNTPDTVITALARPQNYEVYARAICASGDTSRWSNVKEFFTKAILIKTPLPGGTYTIDSTKITANNNFQSFYDCAGYINVNGISGPITIEVVKGTGPYNNQFILDSIDGSSGINTLTIHGNGETIEFAGNVNNQVVVGFSKCSNLIIDSLNVKSLNDTYGTAYYLGKDVDSSTIMNSTISFPDTTYAGNLYGIYVNGGNANYITIKNNFILGSKSGGADWGIYFNKPINNQIYQVGNKVINNKVDNYSNIGIYLEGIDGFIVSGNELSKELRRNSDYSSGINISKSKNGLVEKNLIHDFRGKYNNADFDAIGIAVASNVATASSPIVVANNVIYNLVGRDKTYGIQHTGNEHVHYYHNSISIVNYDYHNGITVGIGLTLAGTSGITAMNNSIFLVRSSSSAVVGLDYPLFNSSKTVVSDYNNVYAVNLINGGEYYGRFYNWGSSLSTYPDLAGWQTGPSIAMGQNSLEKNPMYYSDTDLRPLNKHLDNAGSPGLIVDDYNGTLRAPTPDIGAFEIDTSLLANVPYYPIHQINNEDVDGMSDSLNVRCWTSGTVLGINLAYPNSGIKHFLSENTSSTQEGIYMFNNLPSFSYALNEGDSLQVLGIVNQINGLTSIYVDSIKVIDTNTFVPVPINFSAISDSLESKLVQFTDLTVTRPFFYQTFEASNGVDTIVFFVNDQTDIADSLMNGNFNYGDTICSIVGIGYQDDDSYPFKSNYGVMPMGFKYIDTVICQIVSIKEFEGNELNFNVFPNPTNGKIFIEANSENSIFEVKLYSILGKEIWTKKFISGKTTPILIDESPGIYFLELKGEAIKKEVFKIIKR